MSTNDQTQETKTMQERYPRTISQELYDAWQVLRRKGDPEKIRKKVNASRPKVDLALNYGHVHDTKLIDKISKFFKDRLAEEKEDGGTLLSAVTAEA